MWLIYFTIGAFVIQLVFCIVDAILTLATPATKEQLAKWKADHDAMDAMLYKAKDDDAVTIAAAYVLSNSSSSS